jgi:hypothetical protein
VCTAGALAVGAKPRQIPVAFTFGRVHFLNTSLSPTSSFSCLPPLTHLSACVLTLSCISHLSSPRIFPHVLSPSHASRTSPSHASFSHGALSAAEHRYRAHSTY